MSTAPSEIGRFARRVVRGGEVLTVAEVWRAWCEHNDEPSTEATTVGGIPRLRLSTVLRGHVAGLPTPKQIRIKEKNHRGWRRWRLLKVEAPITHEMLVGLKPSVRPRVIASRLVDEARRRLAYQPNADSGSYFVAVEIDRMMGWIYTNNTSQWDGGIPPVDRDAMLRTTDQGQLNAAITRLLRALPWG